MTSEESEIKGSWFVTLAAWLDAEQPGARPRIVGQMPAATRHALREPELSRWYPESALGDALRALDGELTRGDRARLVDILDACTALGVSRFFRVLLRVSTPGFVLRQIPTLWTQVRRGRGRVSVREDGAAFLVVYEDFPPFAEPLYAPMTEGMLRALVRLCTGVPPRIEVLHRASAALTLRITPVTR